jgi:hypothetical protein
MKKSIIYLSPSRVYYTLGVSFVRFQYRNIEEEKEKDELIFLVCLSVTIV